MRPYIKNTQSVALVLKKRVICLQTKLGNFMKIINYTFLGIILLTQNTFANMRMSGGVGNGGDVLICPDRVEKVILLDSYEAQKMGLTLDLQDKKLQTQTWRSMINVAVNRLRKKDNYTASLLYTYAMEMVEDFDNYESYPGRNVYLGNDVNTAIDELSRIHI